MLSGSENSIESLKLVSGALSHSLAFLGNMTLEILNTGAIWRVRHRLSVQVSSHASPRRYPAPKDYGAWHNVITLPISLATFFRVLRSEGIAGSQDAHCFTGL